jgi:hypothetical protein
MKEWLRGLSSTTVTVVFTILFVVPFLMGLFPPLYLWGSRWKSGALFLGMPFSMWYWVIGALWIFFALWAYYGVQSARGENEEHVEPSAVQKTEV